MSLIDNYGGWFINPEQLLFLRPVNKDDRVDSRYKTMLVFSNDKLIYSTDPPEAIAARIYAAGTPLVDSVKSLTQTCAEQRKLIDDAAATILELQDHIKLMRAELAALKEDR